MQLVLIMLHVVVCLALIVIVLLQTGKGSEIGAVFGGSSQTLFGSTGGSTFFGKLTTVVAVVFMVTSLILAGRSGRYASESIMNKVKPAATAPVTTESLPLEPVPAGEAETQAAEPAVEGDTAAPQAAAEEEAK